MPSDIKAKVVTLHILLRAVLVGLGVTAALLHAAHAALPPSIVTQKASRPSTG